MPVIAPNQPLQLSSLFLSVTMVPAKEALALLIAYVLLNCHALIVRLPLTCTMRSCIFHIFGCFNILLTNNDNNNRTFIRRKFH